MTDIEKHIRAAVAEANLYHARLKRDNLKVLFEETARKLDKAEREAAFASAEMWEAQNVLREP